MSDSDSSTDFDSTPAPTSPGSGPAAHPASAALSPATVAVAALDPTAAMKIGPPRPQAASNDPTIPLLNIAALLTEVASKAPVMWVGEPSGRAYPVWYVWHDDAAYVVSGPGEQHLPNLPATVELTFRSKDSHAKLLTVRSTAEVVPACTAEWHAAAELLKPRRLNAHGDVVVQWAGNGVIHHFRPFGAPLEGPGAYSASRAAEPVPTGFASAVRRLPWHLGGRPQRRLGTR